MATLGRMSKSLWLHMVKKRLSLSGGTTALELFTTSDSPRYTDSVPSVMMITGMRSRTARSPLTRPSSGAEQDAEPGGQEGIDAGHHDGAGDDRREVEDPADGEVDVADDDDEDHAHGQHAGEGSAREQLPQRSRQEEVGVGDADEHDERHQRHDDTGLFGQPRTQRAQRRRGALSGRRLVDLSPLPGVSQSRGSSMARDASCRAGHEDGSEPPPGRQVVEGGVRLRQRSHGLDQVVDVDVSAEVQLDGVADVGGDEAA